MKNHWLTRESTIKQLWLLFIAVLAFTVIADLFIEHHPHFGIDGTFGFGAWFGFASCIVLIVLAKLLGAVLKRRDTYYDR